VAGQASGSRARSAHRPGQKECLYTKRWEASSSLSHRSLPFTAIATSEQSDLERRAHYSSLSSGNPSDSRGGFWLSGQTDYAGLWTARDRPAALWSSLLGAPCGSARVARWPSGKTLRNKTAALGGCVLVLSVTRRSVQRQLHWGKLEFGSNRATKATAPSCGVLEPSVSRWGAQRQCPLGKTSTWRQPGREALQKCGARSVPARCPLGARSVPARCPL